MEQKIGRQIKNPMKLMKLKVVWDNLLQRHQTIGWIQNYPFRMVIKDIENGRYYEYKSK